MDEYDDYDFEEEEIYEDLFEDEYDYDLIDGVGFADPNGNSALRAETKSNPRNQPCPTCREENVLTPMDVRCGYQCDNCAEKAEGHGF